MVQLRTSLLVKREGKHVVSCMNQSYLLKENLNKWFFCYQQKVLMLPSRKSNEKIRMGIVIAGMVYIKIFKIF